MGNQARQSQEVELWQVVSSSGNVRSRQTTARRTDMQRRRNASDRSRTRVGSVQSQRQVRPGNARVRSTRTVHVARTGHVRSEYGGRGGQVRSVYARPAGQTRAANPGIVRSAGAVRRTNIRAVKKRKAGKRARTGQFFAFAWVMLMCAAIFFMGRIFYESMQVRPVVKADRPPESTVSEELPVMEDTKRKPDIQEDFLTISEYNRPGTELACVRNIFVHYTANPKTSAAQNRSYFENLGQTHERAASAHFIIGYEGEIIQCIPLEEEAYAVVERNGDSISIECCYLSQDGSFTQETYDSLVEMLAWLLDQYNLEPKDILRHYDCGGKLCPVYYVKHEDAWQKLLDDVAHYKLLL